MWFDSWADALRVLIVGAVSYVSLVALLRFSGKRTLSQLNAFDFIITVALGSTLATILLSSDVAYVEGTFAFVLLAGLQFLVAFMSSKWPGARDVIAAEPVALLLDGKLQEDELRRNRLSKSEVFQAVRGSGSGDLSSVAVVILETNGKISVIPSSKLGNGSALEGVAAVPKQAT